MAKRADPWIEKNQHQIDALCSLNIEYQIFRYFKILAVFTIGGLLSASVKAQEPKPLGVKGWWHYISVSDLKSGYASTPEEACVLNAANHFGVKLLGMTASEVPKPRYQCFYKNPVGGRVHDYSDTYLVCESGYTAKSPGVCVEWPETPRPPSCSPDQPGFALANPVALSSGAKVQTETDILGPPNGALRITRTYRTLRDGGGGQSAGQGWSFSFDRQFTPFVPPLRKVPSSITGAFGDGSSFEFQLQDTGKYVSKYDKRETLQNLNAAYDEWMLTTRDGSIERFKKVSGKFLLVSSHTKEGIGQFYTYTPENKLETVSDASGRALTVTWAGNAVASITGETGSVRYRYDMVQLGEDAPLPGTERLMAVEVVDEGERLLTTRSYHYEAPNYRHLLTGITDENGVRFATYGYNESGQVILSEHAGGTNRYTFAYPEKGKRIVTDPLGTQRQIDLDYGRDSLGRVTGASQPAGAGCGPGYSKLTYDTLGRPSSSTDFNENKTCFITEPVRGLVTSRVTGLAPAAACPASGTAVIAPASRRISSQWHPDVEFETAVASAKQITRYVYNGQPGTDGKVASCADNAALPNGKPIVVLCAKTIQATRDANGTQGFAAQPDGRPRTWRYSYNAAGQLFKRTGPADALGQAESISLLYYDDTTASHTKSDLASTQNAVGEVTQFLEYTKDGLASKIKRADGVIVNLAYGPMQRLVSSTVEDGKGGTEVTRYTYDDAGQLTRLVSPDGSTVTFAYDDAQRLTSLTDGAGNRVQMTLDQMGNVTRQEIRNAAGNLVRESNHAFDALNRLAGAQRDPQSPATTYQYDRSGNLTALRDAMGRVTKREFDNLDRVVKAALPPAAPGKPNSTIGIGFDHQDQLVSVTDPRNMTTRYALNGYGQRTSLTSPDTGTTVYTFDDAGNLISSRDARGVTLAYRYDAARRLTKIGDITFEYGKGGSSATGRLKAMTDESGKSSFSYDGFGRLQTKIQTVGSGTGVKQFALAYKYGTSGTGTGHFTSMTYPSGNRIDIAYGSDGRAASLTLAAPNAASPKAIMSGIRYAPLGSVQSWTWGNPASPNVYKREFDANGRVKSYPLGSLGGNGTTRALNYDQADRIKSMVHTGSSNAIGLNQNYAYDDLDRLTGVEGANISQAFEYDANGNRVRARFGSGIYTNTIHSASNRMTKTTGPVPAKTNTYDKAGNLVNDGSAKFTYGTTGRLATVVVAGVTTSYRYNGFGERVAKAGAANTLTYYVYDPAGRLVGEYDGAGMALQETVYLGDLAVAVLKPGANQGPTEVFNVYADHILTPRVITRASDNRMVWRWDNTDPFGFQQPDESPSGLPKFTYNARFPGQVYDKETNTHYNYYRDYDPQTGRYVQSDPIGLAGGANTYSYVGGNPITRSDPFGLACPADLKARGMCFDADEYDKCADGTSNNRGTSDDLARSVAGKLDTDEHEENVGRIKKDGTFEMVSSSGVDVENIRKQTALVPNDGKTKEMIHSHPYGDIWLSSPGPDDGLGAGYPNYIVRSGLVGVVEIVDGQYQYRLVRGRLNKLERSETQKELNGYRDKARARTNKNFCSCAK